MLSFFCEASGESSGDNSEPEEAHGLPLPSLPAPALQQLLLGKRLELGLTEAVAG